MVKEIIIGAAQQLQFGSYIQIQITKKEDGVTIHDEYISFDGNKFSVAYDTNSPNIAVFHFDGHIQSVSNADYNMYSFGGIAKATPVDLAVSVVSDIAQYTT